ncbi:MAG: hypothetical protein PHT58_08520 [Eubacteriales bacterium]|nr:hypothetical protein [Eubacteriales bacterium]
MKKYTTTTIEVLKFQVEDILTTSATEWHPNAGGDNADRNPTNVDVNDIWNDLFGGNP